ncbi:MAG: hypothetical protein H6R20_811 [Proteobacteria bacterium]|jgi:hypothetical protein|nr:hypothetical protein [Pseudomonadota bacterium]
MAESSANAVLHLPERPRSEVVEGLVKAIASLPGVGRVARGLKLTSVVLVHYDSSRLHAYSFIEVARRQGLVARLVST